MAMTLRTRVLTLSAVVAAAAGLSAPGLAAAATATAAAGLIAVTSAGSPAASVGDLSIGLEATSTVDPASLTASLYAAGATTPALTVTGFTQTGGPATGAGATTWTVATPIPAGSGPGELPLGSYRIEVTAADDGGDTTDDTDAGTLAYLVQPAITLTVSPATVSYGQQVTISGTDTGLYPDGSHQPVVGQEVDFITQSSATTNASGKFTFTVQAGIGQAGAALGLGPVFVHAVADATTAGSYSPSVPVTIQPVPVQFTRTLTPSVVQAGAPATLSGTVSFESGPDWLPLTGTEVDVIDLTSRNPNPLAVTTDPSGTYAFTLRTSLPTEYQLSVEDGDSVWFANDVQDFVIVPDGIQLSESVSARMTGTGRLQLTGCEFIPALVVTGPAPAPYPTVHLEYAATASGPWHALASGKPGSTGCYTATVKVPGLTDFYRMATYSDPAYADGTSTAVRATPASKSAITAFTAGPRKLTAGRRVKVTGRLTGTGTKPGQTVVLYFKQAGSGRWRVIGRVRVSASRSFSESARLYHSGDIEVRYGGAAFTRPCRSRVVYIRVTR
jgi:hypothetical protein